MRYKGGFPLSERAHRRRKKKGYDDQGNPTSSYIYEATTPFDDLSSGDLNSLYYFFLAYFLIGMTV
jgi:hypothetical protein